MRNQGKQQQSKGKAKFNGKKRYVKKEIDDRTDSGKGPELQKFNDAMWYAKNEQMLRDAASYSYNNPIGSPLPANALEPAPNTGASLTTAPKYVPSLMTLRILPTIGKSVDSSSPANLAANNIYAYVRYQNSGAKNYDQADLMLYLLAMDSLYSAWNWMKRIYGYINQYSQYNLTIPRVFAWGDHINFDSVQSSLADFRLFLNRTAAQISSFCVPAVMPYFIRHSWMFSNIYKDSDSNKAQLYMFVPEAFYMYSETSSQYGGELIPMQVVDNTGTAYAQINLSSLETYLQNLINSVAYSEDIGVMSGDILKAYGQDKLFKLTPVDPDYTVSPVYNEEVLNQIHNSNVMPTMLNDTNKQYYKVTQDPDTGYLIWNPNFEIGTAAYPVQPASFMVNMPWDDVTPANTMVGTRLITDYSIDGTNRTISLNSCGTEVVAAYEVVYSYRTTGGTARDFNRDVYRQKVILVPNLAAVPASVQLISRLSNFDWHPLFNVLAETASLTYTDSGLVGDINNYTVMNGDDIAKLHLTAVMSEFNIPQLGSF